MSQSPLGKQGRQNAVFGLSDNESPLGKQGRQNAVFGLTIDPSIIHPASIPDTASIPNVNNGKGGRRRKSNKRKSSKSKKSKSKKSKSKTYKRKSNRSVKRI
jgi:hypothetical protein